MKATGIDAIFFAVNDVPRAIAFYKELLDIKETSFETVEHGAEWVLADGSAFGVGKYPGKWAPSGCVLFAVPDVEAAAARVPQIGGKLLEGVRDFPACRSQWCEDPDGNSFVLHQRTSGGA